MTYIMIIAFENTNDGLGRWLMAYMGDGKKTAYVLPQETLGM